MWSCVLCSWRPPCSRQYRCWSEKPRGGKKEGSVIQLATGPWNCVILRAMELWLNTNRQSVFGIAKFSSILFCRLWGHGWTFIKYSASGYSVPGWRSKSLDHHSPWIQDLLHDQIWRKKCQTIGHCLCYLCSTFNSLSVSIVSSALWEPRVCYRRLHNSGFEPRMLNVSHYKPRYFFCMNIFRGGHFKDLTRH